MMYVAFCFLSLCYVQVFIRTVNQNADASDSNMTMNMSALDTSLALSPSTGSDSIPVFQEVNKCGLTSRFTKLCTGTSCCLAIIFLIVPIAAEMNDSSAGSAILSLLFFVSLFTAICGCSLLYCACCKPAVGSDEQPSEELGWQPPWSLGYRPFKNIVIIILLSTIIIYLWL